jgi:ABC-type dipeptide/oligopeptide/nickel transport system ATPase component
MTPAPLLSIRALQVVLRLDDGVVPILDGIDLDLAPGKVMALVGESGSGKSVTAQAILRILPRMLQIAGGTMLLRANGTALDLAGVPADGAVMQGIRGRRIGMIFQEPMSSFSPLHTVGNQVGEVLRIHERLSKQAARERTIELLDRVGIPNPARAVDRYPFEFSGGMRQRAMIAKALSCNPALLLADEPTTALDVTIQAQILTLMRDLQAEFGMGILFITHDLGVRRGRHHVCGTDRRARAGAGDLQERAASLHDEPAACRAPARRPAAAARARPDPRQRAQPVRHARRLQLPSAL